MTKFYDNFYLLGAISNLSSQIITELFRGPFYFKLFVEQLFQIGVKSLPLVLTVVVMVGMVMALQFGVGLEKFGGKLYIPKIVSSSIIRELGPVFTSLMLAARVGAGITSEIGSMKVTQQIDAIRALGTSPIRVIVIPRVIACIIALPLLTIISNIGGVMGGLAVGVWDLGLDPQFYYQKILSTIHLFDYFSGFIKTFFFAIIISVVGCYFGLNVSGGTRGVGLATTKSVVISCISIVVGDFFLTKILIMVEVWL